MMSLDDVFNGQAPWPSMAVADASQIPVRLVTAELSSVPVPAVTLTKRVMCGGICVAEKTAWTWEFASCVEATLRYEWMARQSAELEYWACHAEMFGGDALKHLIEEKRLIDAEFRERFEHRQVEDAEFERTLSARFSSHPIERRGQYGFALRRGAQDQELWSILFHERWERDRFGDWWAHQRARFQEFVDLLQSGRAVEIERLVLDEMLRTERRVKNAGLGSGGRRPLRFWRGDR